MTGTFTAGAVLTASNLNTAINSLTLNAQSGAGYTLVLADAGKLVTVSNASAQNLTIPLNSSVAYATGTVIEVLNIGAGTWTLVPTGGVTLTGSTSIPTSARVRLTKTGTDTWYANTLGGGSFAYVTGSSFSAAATTSVNSCFTSTYDNYLVIMRLTGSTAINLTVRLRASAVDSATTYDARRGGLSAAYATTTATTAFPVGVINTGMGVYTMTFNGPALAASTAFISEGASGATPDAYVSAGQHTTATAYDGFSVICDTGNITGSLKIYGLSNS